MPQPGARYGEFVLRREIGRGAMGTVWEAKQESLDRTVAVKILAGATASDPVWVQRFKIEAGAVAKLSHSGILPVYGIGETDGRHWFAMEYVAGQDLAARLAEQGPLPPRNAATVIRDAAKAIHHAHEHGVIHRDVKPANVMLRDDGRVTVTDFGLAKHLGSGALTTTGLLVGTPYYMSPELVNAKGTQDVGPASDVYGLGVTLYELLTGKPPFDAPNPMALLKLIGEKDPTPPTAIDPKIPRDLETILLTCMRKRPERRYASAEALADDLERFLDGQPIAVRRPGLGERVARFVSRNRVATGVAAASVLVLLGAVLFFTNALKSQEADYERRIREILAEADTLADAGDVTAAEGLYAKAEEVSAETPEAKHHVHRARAGRQLIRLLQSGAIDHSAVHGAAAWRAAPEGRVRFVTEPPNVTVRARALRADGLEEDVAMPAGGGEIEPGLYRIELSAPGYVDAVVNLVAVPGMDTEIHVALPKADDTTAGMKAFLGDWRPNAQTSGPPAPGHPVDVRRHGTAFLFDAHRTTNAEYAAFLAAQPEDLRRDLTPRAWRGGRPPADALDRPVRGVTPDQAAAFATWRGKRLPTRREFQTAVVPEVVMTVAHLQHPRPPGTPPGAVHPEGRPAGADDVPTLALFELRGEKADPEEVLRGLRDLKKALATADDSLPPAAAVGPWTFTGRTRSGTAAPALGRLRGLEPGLRLARDLD